MERKQLQTIRRDLHQIPELGFQEHKTHAYLMQFINSLPQQHIKVETWKTGIFVKLEGTEGEKTIGYRADIDGLPIKEETGLPFSSTIEGNMHACGHDFHMTIALGALKSLTERRPKHNVLFIFQPAEEGPGGALPMLQTDTMKKWRPDTVFALHIAPELPVGTVSSKEGLLFANTSELFIDFHGKGGHAAYPHKTKDMVVAASQFVVDIQQIIARMIDPLDSAVITVGKMEGGFVQNVIAEHARLEGTIRTLTPEAMTFIKEKIEKYIEAIELRYDCQGTVDYGSNYYQVYNDRTYVDQFSSTLSNVGVRFVEAPTAMTGEDFGYMLKEIPGFMFWLGVNSDFGLHNGRLNPKEEALEVGVKVVTEMIHQLTVHD
ncbi:N-acetyldiaminopimelate deacetylase [Salirhabdus salicampi]|uniref:N-acetyldiaminopimelate deacetylase n=1 Tax=Salirhabdus salicampi TaxID=476102 RepID=UPI0020C46AC7|nr:N-acetyldiaminopimelate deacetylase [Salirhabdus salicampi]MCP8616035.1 N-acetyldiaminopimelate deacetylase [Salirhabdus salicampi]